MDINNYFTSLQNEAQFTKEILGIGVTQIRKADCAYKGIYYQSFACLSTGLERIGKLTLLLDYYLDNGGTFPDDTYLNSTVGHDLQLLHNKGLSIVEKRNITLTFSSLKDEVHQNMVAILSEFAKGDRYSNIQVRSDSGQQNDSIQKWSNLVDYIIYETYVTAKRKEKIHENAELIDQMLASVRQISENGLNIDNVGQVSLHAEVQEVVAPYRQLFVLQIIRFWVELLSSLSYEAVKLGSEDIPYFNEVFADYYHPDSYFQTRRTWDNI